MSEKRTNRNIDLSVERFYAREIRIILPIRISQPGTE